MFAPDVLTCRIECTPVMSATCLPADIRLDRSSLVTPCSGESGSATRRLAVNPTHGERDGAEPRVLAVRGRLAENGTGRARRTWSAGTSGSYSRYAVSGVITAAWFWVSWSGPGRSHNEAAFAALAGTIPIQARHKPYRR